MKKLIVLATLAALPAVALADVQISGNIGVAITNVKTGDGAGVKDMAHQEGDILFSGSEDLGNGLKAFWKYDHQFNADKVTAQDENLETVIGLSGSFGKVQLGATDNAAREIGSVGLADLPTVFGVHSTADQDSVYKSARKRVKDGITYVAPTFNGVTVALSQSLKGGTDNTTGGATGVGIKYVVNDMLTLAYAGNFTKMNDGGVQVRNKAHELNAAATFGDFGLNLGYAWDKRTDASDVADAAGDIGYAVGDVVKRHGVAVSGSYSMGATTLIAGYYKQADDKVNGTKVDGTGYTNITLGVNYDLSKRTHVGVEYSKANYDGKDNDQRGIATYIWHSF